jgi:hypothetical protein
VAEAEEGRDDPAQVVVPTIPHTDALRSCIFSRFTEVAKNSAEEPLYRIEGRDSRLPTRHPGQV